MSTEDVRGDAKKKGFGGKFSSLRKKKKGAHSSTAEEDLGPSSPRDVVPDDDIPAGALASELAGINKYAFFALDVELKEGHNLAARDKTDSYIVSFEHESVYTKEEGLSDPYVKVKADGKQVYKSKTIPKTLNPQWNEKFCVAIDDVSCPLTLKVYDSDKVGNDDFMGRASVDLAGMEVNKANKMKIELEGGDGKEKLGHISVTFTISPKGVSEHQESKRIKTGPREPKIAGKDQMWDGLVSITLVEGSKLIPMDDTGFSDPYCRFRLGNEKYKSKACKETLTPYWKEQFDLKFWDDTPMMLEVTVWDKDIRKDEFMGRCQIDLDQLARERSHKIVAELEDGAGVITMHVAITALDAPGCESDINTYVEEPNRRSLLVKSFGLKSTGKKIKEIGWLVVKYHRAVGLASADIGGASDPFTVIELNNQRLVTPTIYKTLNPSYEKVYEMPVNDIHDTLDFTIYDEDKRGAPEFLGKVCIPLLHISNGEKRLYQLKDKSLERRAKGHLILTLDVIYNPVRAGIRTINPRDPKVLFEPTKFKRALLQRNIDRVKKLGDSAASTGAFVGSLFTWQYKFRSAFGFMIYIMLCLNFDFYIIPLTLLLTFLKQYVICMLLTDRNINPEEQEGAPADEDDDDDDDDEPAKGKKGEKGQSFKEKMAALTNICQTVQNALDLVAGNGERVKNIFNWTVPFCSYMMCVAMTAGTVVLYIVPLKFLLLAWGINKFTKKIRKPNAVDNNEAADFLSRIPSDIEVKQYKLLKTDPALRVKRIEG